MKKSRTTNPRPTNDEAEECESGDKWRFLEHTADVRMEVYGVTLQELFLNAAEGFTCLLASGAHIEEEIVLEIILEAAEPEELLVNWLRELLYEHETRGFLLSAVDIFELASTKLRAKVTGNRRSSDDQREIEIKGVTYHAISVEKTVSGYSAKILFDI